MKKMMIMSLVLSLVFIFSGCASTNEEQRTYPERDTEMTTPEQVRNDVNDVRDTDIRTAMPKNRIGEIRDNDGLRTTGPDNAYNDARYNNEAGITMRDELPNDAYDVESTRVGNEMNIDGQLLKRASRDAKNVCTRLDGMPGVDEVSCVISGDDCFVSVLLDENCTENQKNAVLGDTYMVCKNTNQTLQDVYLNFGSDMHSQIKGYMDQMNTSGSTVAPKISQIKSSMQDVTIR